MRARRAKSGDWESAARGTETGAKMAWDRERRTATIQAAASIRPAMRSQPGSIQR